VTGNDIGNHLGPKTFEAAQCVIALPLGVLQAGCVHFDPAPVHVMDAAAQLAMGSAKRISFVFREPFWQKQYPETGFFFGQNELPGVWWTPAPNTAPLLTGWIGGPRALNAAIAEREDFASVALQTLARFFAMPEKDLRGLLVSWHAHDWQRDPFSRGAYSYAPKGALHASDAMAESVESTLFFAGEHTDTTRHWGTVHGALRSGLRAAKQILEA
jgi:monoamine oxidase